MTDIFKEEPERYCPICRNRVFAKFEDNGFGPYSMQMEPYICDKCNWVAGGCTQKECIKERCKSYERCKGQSLENHLGNYTLSLEEVKKIERELEIFQIELD